jgi:hypothetical protein
MAHCEVWPEVVDLRRQSVYSGLMLFDLVITFLVVRSFTDKPKESNSIEHQLSVVKMTNRKNTLNNIRRQQNIVKLEWSRNN